MRTFRAQSLISIAALSAAMFAVAVGPAGAQVDEGQVQQTAVEAALTMANILDGAGGGISSDALVTALTDAATAGQPMALWQLGLMYESGEGVEKDPVKAFGYFSQIADEHADTAPHGVEADIVAQSFVKVGEYYREGLPAAGVKPNRAEYASKVQHAAMYFGNADAQYLLGELYADEDGLGNIPVLSYRWLMLAARKGHAGAQAQVGDMLFNGDGIDRNPVDGLMWLTVASRRAAGTGDESWIRGLLQSAMSVASPEQRQHATVLADSLDPRFSGQ